MSVHTGSVSRGSVRGRRFGVAVLAVSAMVGIGAFATAQAALTITYSQDNKNVPNKAVLGKVYTAPSSRAGVENPPSEWKNGWDTCRSAYPATRSIDWTHAEAGKEGTNSSEKYSITWVCFSDT